MEESFWNDAEAAALMIVLDDDADDIDDRRREIVHVDIEGFRALDTATFRAHFRMDKGTFQVLVPFIAGGNLTRRQRKHNRVLSSARSSVERSFANLKGKFRRLKMFPSVNLDIALDHIMASIVVHNFIILGGNEPTGLVGGGNHIHAHGQPRNALIVEARNAGMFKREYIAALISPEE